MKVKLTYQEALTTYTISRDAYQIYECRLLHFEGSAAVSPPSFFLLARGEGGWMSNIEQEELIGIIGSAIDRQSAGK